LPNAQACVCSGDDEREWESIYVRHGSGVREVILSEAHLQGGGGEGGTSANTSWMQGGSRESRKRGGDDRKSKNFDRKKRMCKEGKKEKNLLEK
jgi:hypothetical protein